MEFVIKIWNLVLSYLTLLKYKIIYGRRFEFGRWCRVRPSLIIRISGTGKVILGNHILLRENVIINSSCGEIVLGDGVFLNDFVCVNAREKIVISENTLIGQGVKFYDHDHDYRRDLQNDFRCSPIYVGRHVWIGADSILLRGTSIGDDTVVGAGSLVKEELPSRVIYMNRRDSKVLKNIDDN